MIEKGFCSDLVCIGHIGNVSEIQTLSICAYLHAHLVTWRMLEFREHFRPDITVEEVKQKEKDGVLGFRDCSKGNTAALADGTAAKNQGLSKELLDYHLSQFYLSSDVRKSIQTLVLCCKIRCESNFL